ncbi:6937_t:CDS:2, partial [Funneliformis geosporum]
MLRKVTAKTLAVARLSEVGRDNYGIFPLRGKLLNPGTYMNHDDQEEITITDFINRELIFFSRADNERSIPKGIKVSSLSGAVLEQAAYHHSDASLHYRNGSRFCRFKQPSARYISVTIPDITRKIFNPQDDSLLSYRNDDGQLVEPE